MSWRPAGDAERLFMSALAEQGEGKAIRGGVPVIFPQFSDHGPLPRHGLVRTTAWALASRTEATARFQLADSERTRAVWPYPFRAEMEVAVGGKDLTLTLRITNTGTASFSFTAALHTYFAVQDVAKTAVQGLQGCSYIDALTKQRCMDNETAVRFPGEVDRGYLNVGAGALSLVEAERRLEVRASGFPDAVVWNPGEVTGGKIKDLEAGGYRKFVCIEGAAIGEPITLEPSCSWSGSQVATAITN